MSVNSDMVLTEIFDLREIESVSGFKKEKWTKRFKKELVTIYQASQYVNIYNFRNTETTHQGLTYCRNFEAKKTRIKFKNNYYEVLSVDTNHRLTLLELKSIKPW